MSDKTGIQWTDATWNPISGCSKVSAGCKNCYAERDWARLSKNPRSPYFGRAFTEVKMHPERLDQPLRWRRPRRIFVNSMSDLFHEDVPEEFIDRVFSVMASARQHTFQVLTKRPARMRDYLIQFKPSPLKDGYITRDGKSSNNLARGEACFAPDNWPLRNVHLYVSAEDQDTFDARIINLLSTPAAVHGVSLEPLLGPIDLSHNRGRYCHRHGRYGRYSDPCCRDSAKIDHVIVGGESGPDARPCFEGWLRFIVRDCQAFRIPVFVKQYGSHAMADHEGQAESTQLKLRHRHGGDPAEWAPDLRVREQLPRCSLAALI